LNGAETLVRTLLASGVNTCFANPGTSEMHFVAALDRVPGTWLGAGNEGFAEILS
jgi:acetolactate synthase-1/2/3 large subunit